MSNFISFIFLLINLHILSAKIENINQIKHLDFYKDKITEDAHKQLQCLNKNDEDLCKKYDLKINHVRCKNLNFNKTIEKEKWNCEIILKKKPIQLKEFTIECNDYQYNEPNILIANNDNNLKVETCFLEYNLQDIDLTQLNIRTRPIDLKIILEASTGSFVGIFLIFLLTIQFKNPNNIHSSTEDTLPTQNSAVIDSNKSQILLQNIDKNIDKIKTKISLGFAGNSIRGAPLPLTASSSSGIANTSFR